MKAKIKLIPFLLLAFIMLTANCCEKDEEKNNCACDVEKPQENIQWLKELLEKSFCAEIYLYTHEGKEYIGVHDCPGTYDGGWVIYNCDGTVHCKFIGISAECDCTADFLENFEKTLIYMQDK